MRHGVSHHGSGSPNRRIVYGLLISLYFSGVTSFAATLQEQVDSAIGAFTSGDYATAYWQFEATELDFGEEPEFTSPDFQRIILPIRAYAAMAADRPTDALIYFAEVLREPHLAPGIRAFVLYNAAIAQSQAGAPAAAARTFAAFRQTFPGTHEAALAQLQEADLNYEIGDSDRALEQLDSFFHSDAPISLRLQGRLRALQIANETGDSALARKLLFETDWQVSQMPDIAVLTFAAIEAGDLLLESGEPLQAIQAYRLALPLPTLREKQAELLQRVGSNFAAQRAFASSIWKSHTSRLIERLESQLERLNSMADYTPGLYLRSGQAYLLAGRYHEATLLFKTIAKGTEFEKDIRAEAHYRWILALGDAENWIEARDCAQEFLREHPGHHLANPALFLIARAFQAEGRYQDAIRVLDDLIQNFPQDRQAARWTFTRGHNYCVLEAYGRARQDFETGLQDYPDSPLITQLELWAGLTYFFERNYSTALEKLLALTERSQSHPLYPEIQFRIANTVYAQRDYERTLETIRALVENFPEHHRIPEAEALRGDAYMGLGELIQAAAAFKNVPDDDSQIYDYAVFQVSKIYKALERYDLLRKHLLQYVERDGAAKQARVSEALYWIGWSLIQEDRPETAFPIYELALTRFGDDPEARSVDSILAAYENLFRKHKPENSDSFETWLQTERHTSLEQDRLTWFARLTLFTADRERQAHADAVAEATILSIHRLVPLERQDLPSLAAVGEVLAKRGYTSADVYFEKILSDYSDRFERASAYYGKAVLAANDERIQEARNWLSAFLEETPTHRLAAEARLLEAELLQRQGLYEQAQAELDEMLQMKQLRGRPHARALALHARIATDLEQPKRAIAYWQRIYTLYRAYPELLAPAYWESAALFEALDDSIAARNTLLEMLADERLKRYPLYAEARAKLPSLESAAKAQSELAREEPKELEVMQ